MILTLLLLLIIIIILTIIIIISLPYNYQLQFSYHNKLSLIFNFNILFINFKYIYSQKNKKSYFSIFNYKKELENQAKKAKSKKIPRFKKIKNLNFPRHIIVKDNIDHLFLFLIKLLRKLKPQKFNLNLLISFSDPYYNGILLAYYQTIINNFPHFPINISIFWPEEYLEADGEISGRFMPITFIFTILYFFFSKKSIRIIWSIYKYNKKSV